MIASAAELRPASPRAFVQVACALLRRDGGIVLVSERRGDAVFWSVPGARCPVPGGGVEPGELVSEAVIREIKEEAGVAIRTVGRLAYIVNATKRQVPVVHRVLLRVRGLARGPRLGRSRP